MGGLKQLAVLVLVAIGACLGAAAAHAAAEAEPVTVGVPHDLYPEYAISADDRPGGFGVDVINAVAKRAGLSVTYRVFPTWSDTLAALEHGEIDLIPVVTIIPAREQTLLLTRPVLTSSISIFVRQDEENIRSVAELAGRRMGVIKGGSAPEWLGKGEAAPIIGPYSRVQDEVFALLLGEVDAIITVENSVWKLAESVGVAHRIKVVQARDGGEEGDRDKTRSARLARPLGRRCQRRLKSDPPWRVSPIES